MQLFFRGYPTIRTERLILRQLTFADIADLYDLYNAKETQEFQTQYYYSRESLLQYILSQDQSFSNHEKIMWAIERKSDKTFIGVRVIYNDGNDEYEIQGDTRKIFWRKGYTKEAYKGILKFIKEVYGGQKALVYSKIRVHNENAIALINSLDFKFQKILSENGVHMLKYIKEI
ncbi:MAG: GNAT family N-acetyltransferase [Bacteroidota bacterium]|jgi:ribosomal-protein-alanine N-acetyltransferase